MNQEVNFKLYLKDFLSGAWPKVQGSAQSAFKKIDTSIGGTRKQLDMTGRSAATLERYMKLLERRRKISIDDTDISTANRKLQQVETRLRDIKNLGRNISTPAAGGGGMRGGFGLAGMTRMAAGIGGLALLGSGLTASASAGLQGGAQEMSFKTLAGDTQGAQLYKDLTKYAQQSIFGTEVYKNAQTQLAFGANAGDVMRDSKMLGDVSMGNKDRLGSLTLAYSQSRAAGRLQGQDLLQFVNAGFNPLQEISAKTGRSLKDLRTDMEDGKISFEMVAAAFRSATSEGGKFYKMTERIGQTPFGKVEAAKGQLQGVALQLGAIMAPAIGKFVDNYATPFIEWVGKDLVPKFEKVIETASEFGPMVRDIFITAGNLMKPIAGFVMSADFKGLVKDAGDLALTMGKTLQPAMEDAAIGLRVIAKILRPFVGLADIAVGTIGQDADFTGAVKGYKDAYAYKNRESILLGQIAGSGVAPKKLDLGEMLDPRNALYKKTPSPMMTSPNQVMTSANTKIPTGTDVFAGLGSGSTDAITGGGKKTTIFNFYRELVGEVKQIIGGNTSESPAALRRLISQQLQEIAYSTGGAEER